jgi:polyisoprenoid-binding protein YceI
MKKITFLAALLVASVSSTFAQNWSLDKAHAKLGFTVTHLMLSEVDGNFKNFDVKLTSTKEDFTDAQIELTADVNSINTDNDRRDGHLKGADFFDVAKFGMLTFKSKSLTKVEGKKYKLAGDLTMHGVTKPVTLDVIFNGTAVHPMNKKTVAGFKVSGIINRAAFGVGSMPAAMVSEEVELRASGEFTKD